MSNFNSCEQDIDVELFLVELATESANTIVEKVPAEYRETYLESYIAGLLLGREVGVSINV